MSKAKLTMIYIVALLMSLFLVIGYAQMNSSLQISGTANAERINDIYISNAAGDANSTVNTYVGTALSSSVVLPYSSSTATISITIVNNSETTKVFNAVKYMDDAYSNPNIVYSLNGIQTGTAVPSYKESTNNSITFSITFSFSGSNVSNPRLDSVLLFEFAEEADFEHGGDGGDSGDTGGGTGGDVVIEVGQDFLALIEAAMSNVKNSYGINDPNKGDTVVSAIEKNIVLYSTTNIQGGNLNHFATETLNTHNLDFMFQYSSDTELFLYMWRLKDLEDVTMGQTEITVYKQAYHKKNDKWEKSVTLAGHSVPIRVNSSTIAIDHNLWEVGAPEN
ncbi:MAG: hypothetical protein IJC07_05130 [Clostridia bacterium]|nr:hypothetical protein [Clostridia bacterium]